MIVVTSLGVNIERRRLDIYICTVHPSRFVKNLITGALEVWYGYTICMSLLPSHSLMSLHV